ncbi:S8 family serine peptidase [Roseofilum capinflatum]|uniref:S8 family serine peptidase n=1 Tax=Roseofilum capinflatum BLCC-M114 TaxID=3022440 RepID=A0ABT7B5H6_9CYAN|nr:S8 family serine peptidase [Roseofilum capinflatum]MDJ1174419.1 S8 family serine peptidase [Roseofilum capinflatum BLCC-M114]
MNLTTMDFLKKFFRKNAPKPPKTNPNPGQTFILEPILTPSGLGLDGDAGDGTPPLDGDFDIDLNAADGDDIDTPDDISSTLDAEPTDSGEDDSTAGDNPDVSGGEIDDSDIDDSDIEEISYITSVAEDEGLDTPGNQLDTELQGEGQQTLNPEQVEAKDIEPDGEQEPLAALSANRTSGDSSAEGLSQPSDTETTGGDRVDPIDDNPTGEQSLDPPEEEEEIAPTLEIVPPNFTFDSGVFTVGETGEVGVDFLFDGGGYQGELAIFSLEGMDEFEAGSEEFIQEAATRALSNSELGHVVISDAEEGAKFSGNLGERDQNDGEYLGVKTFKMRSGDEFGVMLVPNKTVARVLDNPSIGGSGRPLFSMVTANPDDAFHVGQIADVTGDGSTFVMEDIRVDGKTDSDYNDVIFQVRGAEGKAALLDSAIASDKEWRYSDLGQALLEYAKPYITPESVETEVSDLIQDVQGLTEALQDAVETLEPEVVEPVETPEEPAPEPETPTSEQPVQPAETEVTDNSADSKQDEQNSDTEETETSDNSTAETSNSEQNEQNSDTEETENSDNSTAETSNSEQNEPNSDTEETETSDNSTAQTSDTEEPEHIHSEQEEPSATDNLIARLDHLTTRLEDAQNAPVSSEEAEQLQTLVQQVETLTETLEQPDYQSFSERAELAVTRVVERLENVAQRIVPIGETPPEFEFAQTAQPLVGIIDTGFSEDNPDIDYARITLGQDHIDNDNNPLLSEGEGNEHGTHILGIIGATENNGIGIDGINDQAPLWVGRAVGSGKWAESLVEFVDAARESGQPNAVVNLSMDLTQIDAQGNVTTRYEFTQQEWDAIEYAREHNVLIVAASGNDGGVMSALGQASQELDNILTVGAAEQVNLDLSVAEGFERVDYSSYGEGLNLVAPGGTDEYPILSTVGNGVGTMTGTSVATAKVTGAASQVWAANPELSYQQVVQILKETATDLHEANSDHETGFGLLNIAAAVQLATVTKPEVYEYSAIELSQPWSDEGQFTATERAAATEFMGKYYEWDNYMIKSGDTLSAIAFRTMGNSSAPYYNFIAQKNGIANPNWIFPGTWIQVPRQVAAPAPKPIPTPPPANRPTPISPPSGTPYTVKRGDTLWAIAQRLLGNGSRWREIKDDKGNPFNESTARRLRIGQVVYLPGGSPSPSPTPKPQPSNTWHHPLPGARVTSEYGPRWGRFHYGIDLGARTETPIRAAKAGRVVYVGWDTTGYGNLIKIQHYDGTMTFYAHLSRFGVRVGQSVSGGAYIGRVGSTGNSTGPHLHFEVRVSPYRWRVNNRNPRNYIRF